MLMQMLPLLEISQSIDSNQLLVELPQNADDSEGKVIGSVIPILYPQTDHYNACFIIESKVVAYLHSSDKIPSNHSLDVIEKPPIS